MLLLLHMVSLPTISFQQRTENRSNKLNANTGLNTFHRSRAHLDKHFVACTWSGTISHSIQLRIRSNFWKSSLKWYPSNKNGSNYGHTFCGSAFMYWRFYFLFFLKSISIIKMVIYGICFDLILCQIKKSIWQLQLIIILNSVHENISLKIVCIAQFLIVVTILDYKP